MLAAVAVAASGCGGASTPASAPVISVVTGLYPLAQVAAEVGGDHVRVTDVVPDGTNPLTAPVGAAAQTAIRSAAVVVDVGGGYQPALEAAAATAPRVVSVTATLGPAQSGPWLDPRQITRLASALQAAFSAANPAAASTYANGATDVAAEMSSVAADFQNSLSDCPRHVIVTADGSFAAMSRSFGLTDAVAGASASPAPADVARAADTVRNARATTVFSEPWVPSATVTAAAGVAGAKVRTLDTLIGAPSGGWPKGATLARLLENDLTVVTSALQCAGMGQN